MTSLKSIEAAARATLLLLVVAAPALAQPSLSSLWPIGPGSSWDYDISVERSVGGLVSGVITYAVANQSEVSPGLMSSCFDVSPLDPTLRPSLLLSVPGCSFDSGVLADDAVALGAWDDAAGDWQWWWATPDLTPGATFRLEFRPGAFVNGEVRTIAGAVVTPAAAFTNAVIVDYVVELGEVDIVGNGGVVMGTGSWEVTGWVAFVPGVGPVAVEDAYEPVEIDCPECPPAVFDAITTTMELRATSSVRSDVLSVGVMKTRY